MCTETLTEIDFSLHLLHNLIGTLSFEGCVPGNHFEKENAHSPDIDFVIIGPILNHFR
jgi:hypothetical protein